MAQRIEENYTVEPGPHGSTIIRVTGRCDGSASTINTIEGGCSTGELVKLPHARGVVFKSTDGTNPEIYTVEPPTMGGRKYRCVKLHGKARPFAPQQDGGVFDGETVLVYEILYQQIGDPTA